MSDLRGDAIKPKGPACQSCGMPLSRDPKGGGTEADHSLSKEFCSHCYVDGKFTLLGIPTLKRWTTKP
jgi:hypothetical protein